MQNISTQDASQIVREHFQIEAQATELHSYDDLNFMMVSQTGEKFLLKLSQGTDRDQLDFQLNLLDHLANVDMPVQLAKTLKTKNGNALIEYSDQITARLLSWIPGRLWATSNPKTENMRKSLGLVAGKLTDALQDFDHPGAHRNLSWDLSNSMWTQKYSNRFSGTKEEILLYFQNRFSKLQELYGALSKSVVHNDLNDYNILISLDSLDPKVVGIIDFGDSLYTQTINDLAILLAYAIIDMPDPLSASLEVISEYNRNYKISDDELKCLYTLVGMRLVTTVVSASIKKEEYPDEEYFVISEKSAWNLLHKWFNINSAYAYYSFRRACGLTAHPLEEAFIEWSKTNQIPLKRMFPSLDFHTVQNLDMSVGSTLLGNPSEYSDAELSEFKLRQLRKRHPDSTFFNGYLEARPFYITNAFRAEGNNGPQYRTVHLGTDFWVAAQTPIHAPYDGIVKIVHNNAFDKDYGPMVILEHEFSGNTFHTLYGHLSLNTLELLQVGQNIKKGDLVAYVGNALENGNWAPHLHFQIILDLLGNNENFNGVAFPSEVDIWKSLCPDPNFIFQENLNVSDPQISDNSLLTFRKEHLGKGLSISYDVPLHIVRGEGVYLMDNKGRKYLDTVNNVNHVGHQHPKVVMAGQSQMAVLNTNTRYLHETIVEYATALLEKLPSHLSVLHFVNSGSEANELALRMAKTITGNEDFLAIEVGYHGNTNAAMDVSSYKFAGEGGSGNPKTTHILPLPDAFRGKYTGPKCGIDYANHAKEIIDNLVKIGTEIAGFIGESMISCGGQVVPPHNYFKEIYKHVRNAGGICIADEVQTGFGRMGKSFWAFELYEVQPDIVTMGKPAGNGHPLAIVACTKEVAEKFNTGMEYFNTFGGNPVSCAVGKAVLEVIEEENLQRNALIVGKYLKEELKNLQMEFPIIGDVRGEGLFLGFELTDSNKKPLPDKTRYLANRMKELGILMSIDGPDHNVLKIKPPLIFSMDNASELLTRLKTVFNEDYILDF